MIYFPSSIKAKPGILSPESTNFNNFELWEILEDLTCYRQFIFFYNSRTTVGTYFLINIKVCMLFVFRKRLDGSLFKNRIVQGAILGRYGVRYLGINFCLAKRNCQKFGIFRQMQSSVKNFIYIWLIVKFRVFVMYKTEAWGHMSGHLYSSTGFYSVFPLEIFNFFYMEPTRI